MLSEIVPGKHRFLYEVLFAIRDVVLTNLSGQCRGADSQLGSRFPYEIVRLAEDIAGISSAKE